LKEAAKVPGIVLIVDDQPVIRRLMRVMLEGENLEVCEAANGSEAVQKAQELNPILIILDLAMPVMNGLEAARVLKLRMPEIPLLMFTNFAGPVLEKEAQSAGFSALVCKSEPGRLLTEANALLNASRSKAS
jgi:CheY-like chemotaxis protein